MKIIRRVRKSESTMADLDDYAMYVGDDGRVHGWTTNRKFAELVTDDVAQRVLAFKDRCPPGGVLVAEEPDTVQSVRSNGEPIPRVRPGEPSPR